MDLSFLRYIWEEEALNHLITGLPTIPMLLVMAGCMAVLWKGSDWMIEGAVSLALRTQVPKIIIGATIISLGTTFPEMTVSVAAAWMGKPGLALGNGVGSIICDTGMIFGSMCLITKIPVDRYVLDRTGWVQVGAAVLLVVIALAGLVISGETPFISREIGVFFLVLLVCYLYVSYLWAKQGTMETSDTGEYLFPLGKSVFMVVVGLLSVTAGSRILIPCAAEGARRMGVPSDIIAATMVAFGTSLPELITAIRSVSKGHPELMVGNIVGADVLNCLFVIGAAALARPLAVQPNFFIFHFPAMLIILFSFRFFIFLNKDGWFKRWQGSWIFMIYVLYVVLQYWFGIGGPPE